MKRDSKQFLALFMAVAMSVTPVSYAYAEDSAVAGVENTESGQQTVEVTDGEIGAADATGQPAEEVTGQEEETTARAGNGRESEESGRAESRRKCDNRECNRGREERSGRRRKKRREGCRGAEG